MGKKVKVYISGRMSGLPDAVVKYRFERCELYLRHQGYKTVNPCRVWVSRWPWMFRLLEKVVGKDRAYNMVLIYDLWLLSRCDMMHLIGSDWSLSRGAKTELAFAQNAKIKVITDAVKRWKNLRS